MSFKNVVFSIGLFCLVYGNSGWSQDTESMPEETPKKAERNWNEVHTDFINLNFGGGYLVDYATYNQSGESKKQMKLSEDTQLRDLRVLVKAKFNTIENLNFTMGYMYDGGDEDWFFRQTGFIVSIPDWNGSFFLGRTKEGFSTNKAVVGYHGVFNERSVANDALIPILADGIKWTGQGFGGAFVYNVGAFKETITPYEKYDKNDEIVAARAVWLPNAKLETKDILHFALDMRYGTSKGGFLQYRSKPESFPAQSYAVDTGKFAADSSTMVGVEAYYSFGHWNLGTEYFFNDVNSDPTNNPFFHGGDIYGAYLIGGVRGYNKKSAIFEDVKPEQSVFNGGHGAWEVALRYSTADFNDENIKGGEFWRITPGANWYLSENVRLEFFYGYSELEKAGTTGSTQYLQTRIQFSYM